MSGMLHPVGPEPARTYWLRRGVLLAVVLVVLLGIVLAVASLTRSAVATAPPPVIAPVDTPTPSPGASTPSTSTPSASTSGASTGTPTPSADAPPVNTPSALASASPPSPSATGPASASPATSAARSASRSTIPSPKPTAKPTTKPAPASPPACQPSDLTVTMRGDRSLAPAENNTFKLAVVNGGAQTCLVSVTDKSFELKIYSGKDRIWSSRDCSKVLKDFDKLLASRADVGWTMTWNGERSVPGKSCKTGSDTPRAGTYWATAQLKGADPVQLRMIIS